MRLKKNEIAAFKDAITERDPDARIYLFGSRVNEQARGGDIDILILSKSLTYKDKLKIKARVFEQLDEQKLHLVIARDNSDPFVKVALQKGTPL